jgi:hypothetical protein
MVTRNLRCPECGHTCERIAIGMKEPSRNCYFCDGEMDVTPAYPSGTIFVPGCGGFHVCDYPKSAAQLKKDYGLDKHDSCDPDSDYNQEGYKEEMAP